MTDATDGVAQNLWDRLRRRKVALALGLPTALTLAWYHDDLSEQRAELGAQR